MFAIGGTAHQYCSTKESSSRFLRNVGTSHRNTRLYIPEDSTLKEI
jgi:hypothetical protein